MPVSPKPRKLSPSRPDTPAVSEEEALRLIHGGGSPAAGEAADASRASEANPRRKPQKKLVQLRLDPELLAVVKELAAKDRRSMHFWLVDAVREKIQREQE